MSPAKRRAFGPRRLRVRRAHILCRPSFENLVLVLRTPKSAWADTRGWVVAINAGMFQTDRRSNVGHLEVRGPVNNPRWHPAYHALLAFDPKPGTERPWAPLNRDGFDRARGRWFGLLQNLRLIADGENRWSKQKKRWSEAAVAVDDEGRLLFLFTRAPFTMRGLNRAILALPLGVRNAMHVEGGPEASLSIRSPKLHLDLSGSFETGFVEHDGIDRQWPIPNALGALARHARRRLAPGQDAPGASHHRQRASDFEKLPRAARPVGKVKTSMCALA
jgi:hypothetical protein